MLKQVVLILFGLLLAIVGVCGVNSGTQTELSNDCFLRIHIRANSNDAVDQNVKYAVKNAVVSYLSPKLVNATTKEQAMEIVKDNLAGITSTADSVLSNNGFSYTSNAKLTREDFPTREYNNVVLPSGEYDSLIVSLGEGVGNNWWCVVYQPLCFLNTTNNQDGVVYKYKLYDIVKSFFGG